MRTTADDPSDAPRPELDPDVGLPHEDLDSPYLEDAQHWLAVYGELLALKRALFEHSAEILSGLSDDAVREASVDQQLLRAQAQRYEIRRRYWVQRAQELLRTGSLQESASEEPA